MNELFTITENTMNKTIRFAINEHLISRTFWFKRQIHHKNEYT